MIRRAVQFQLSGSDKFVGRKARAKIKKEAEEQANQMFNKMIEDARTMQRAVRGGRGSFLGDILPNPDLGTREQEDQILTDATLRWIYLRNNLEHMRRQQ